MCYLIGRFLWDRYRNKCSKCGGQGFVRCDCKNENNKKKNKKNAARTNIVV